MAATNQTIPTGGDVAAFVATIQDADRRNEAELLIGAMTQVTGEAATMWGPTIVGFGTLHLVYASGRELDTFRIGFAPRKAQSVLYVGGGFEQYQDLLPRLGKYATGKSCLYLKKVADADQEALRELIHRSYQWSPSD